MKQMDLQQSVPLTLDAEGVARVVGSRVTLDSVVHQFKAGATAEQIQEDFPSLALRDIYGVIAYYLQHTDAVEHYLRAQAQATEQVRGEVEGHQDSGGLRQRLRERRAQTVK